ncbi:MAG: hypothetical protein HYX97_00050 [Chloroflexi bacterium]|nr:hypothetical protein [Chloroflexota bacterium]
MDKPLAFVHDRRLEGIWPLILAPLVALLIIVASRSYVVMDLAIAPIALVLVAIPGLYRIFWGKSEVIIDKARGTVSLRQGPGGREKRLAALADVQRADVAMVYRGNTPLYRPYLLLKNNTRVELMPDCDTMQQAHAPATAVNDAISLSPDVRSKLAMSNQKAGGASVSSQAVALWLIVIVLLIIAIVTLAVTSRV